MPRTSGTHIDNPRKLGRRLSTARGSVSQRQLAQSVGVSAAYISRIEQGERIPTLQLLEKLANALGVELAWLRGQTSKRSTRRRPISRVAVEAELKQIDAAVKRLRAHLMDT